MPDERTPSSDWETQDLVWELEGARSRCLVGAIGFSAEAALLATTLLSEAMVFKYSGFQQWYVLVNIIIGAVAVYWWHSGAIGFAKARTALLNKASYEDVRRDAHGTALTNRSTPLAAALVWAQFCGFALLKTLVM